MLPDRVSNPGPLTYESGALPNALRGPARAECKPWHDAYFDHLLHCKTELFIFITIMIISSLTFSKFYAINNKHSRTSVARTPFGP